jgi:hypothetical protein
MAAPMTTPLEIHGMSADLSVAPGSEPDTFKLSGIGVGPRKWVHPLTRRAAHILWYRLTWVLFPEKSPRVTGMAATAPLSPRTQSGAVAFVEVIYRADQNMFNVIGWNESARWRFDLDDRAARQLWAALDVVLYPAGWSGTTLTIKPN